MFGNSTVAPSIAVTNPTGCVVRTKDINFLKAVLQNYAYKWRDIGLALDFHPGQLENISQSLPRATTQQLLTELLIQWSQWPTEDHLDVPTLERLCDALRSRLVGLGAVANNLHELQSFWHSQQSRCDTFSGGVHRILKGVVTCVISDPNHAQTTPI